MMWSISWAMLTVCLLAMAVGAVELVRNGKPKASIVAPSEGPPSYAAEVLQNYVERMSGAKLPVVPEDQTVKGTKVVIRVRKGAAKLDGFRIRTSKDTVVVEASIPRGCVYGAYALLEEIGCRFYGPEPLGVIIPKKKTISVRDGLDILKEPAFENRLPSFSGPELNACWGFNFTGYSRNRKLQELIKRIGLKTWRWGHIWPEIVERQFFPDGRPPEKMDYSDKQDWLPADEKGTRRYNGETLCFSNPDAFKWFVENAVNWVLTDCPDADYISMWSADTATLALCQCEKCQAKGWSPTDWYLHIHNEIWRLLKVRGFKGVFGWIAYHGSEEPPQQVKLLEFGRDMDLLYAPRPRGASMHGPITNEHSVNVAYAVLGVAPRLLIASLTAYLVGEFVNAYVLAKLKIATRGRWLWTRTISSTLVTQLLDTAIFTVVGICGCLSDCGTGQNQPDRVGREDSVRSPRHADYLRSGRLSEGTRGCRCVRYRDEVQSVSGVGIKYL